MRQTRVQFLGREDPLEEKRQPTPVFLFAICSENYHSCALKYRRETTLQLLKKRKKSQLPIPPSPLCVLLWTDFLTPQTPPGTSLPSLILPPRLPLRNQPEILVKPPPLEASLESVHPPVYSPQGTALL